MMYSMTVNPHWTGQRHYILLFIRLTTEKHRDSNPLASPKLEILPPGPPSKLETYKIMRNVRKAHITSAKREVPCSRGPAQGF